MGAVTTPLPYPLEKGNYWIYRGNVKWTPEGAGQKVRFKSLTWEMRVRDVIDSPDYRIALVTGLPNDVAWYEEGMAPRYSLLVQNDESVSWSDYQTESDAMNAAEKIANKAEESMDSMRWLLKFPLVKGEEYDQTDNSRTDKMYAWYVKKADMVKISVKGYKGPKRANRFRIVYKTLGDCIIMEFVPGIGITRYIYEHNGTVAFEDMRLVKFGTGK